MLEEAREKMMKQLDIAAILANLRFVDLTVGEHLSLEKNVVDQLRYETRTAACYVPEGYKPIEVVEGKAVKQKIEVVQKPPD